MYQVMAECGLPSSFSSASSTDPSLSSSSRNQIFLMNPITLKHSIIHTEVLVQVNLFSVVSNPGVWPIFMDSLQRMRFFLFLQGSKIWKVRESKITEKHLNRKIYQLERCHEAKLTKHELWISWACSCCTQCQSLYSRDVIKASQERKWTVI